MDIDTRNINGITYNGNIVSELWVDGEKAWPLSPTPIGDFDVRLTLSGGTIEVHTYSDGIIPYNAFSGRTDIVNVEIGDGITTIGHNAFDHCESLSSVTFGSGITTFTQSLFGSMAFSCCYSLTSIELPMNISVVPKYILVECTSLTSVTIPSGVTTVDGGAFSSCRSLSSITCYAVNAPELPNPYTFADMPSEGILYVPYGSDYSSWIGTSATSGDKLGSGWTIRSKVPDNDVVLKMSNNTYSSMTYSGGVIPDYEFQNRQDFKEVYIGDGIKTIGIYAFKGCSAITTVYGDGVETIGEYGFFDNTALTMADFSSIKSIGNRAFNWCKSLRSINLHNVITVGNYAFMATPLTAITFPSTTTSIGNDVLSGCSSLTAMSLLSETMTTVPVGMCNYCSALRTVTLSPSIKHIGDWAFSNFFSSNLDRNSSFFAQIETIGDSAFRYSVIPYALPNIKSIGANAFRECVGSSHSLTLGSGLTTIGQDAFSNTSELSSINIPSGVTSMGNYICYNDTSLTSVTFEEGLTRISETAFTNTRIVNLVIPNSVTFVGSYSFTKNGSLRTIDVGSGVTDIGWQTFCECSNAKSFTIRALTPPSMYSINTLPNNGCPIYVPSSALSTYQSTAKWSDGASRMQAIP